MDKRAARRAATRQLAYAANILCAEVGANGRRDGLSDADRERMVQAFLALKHELDVRSGDAKRDAKPRPADPMQETLFTVEGDDGQEAVAQAADRQKPAAG